MRKRALILGAVLLGCNVGLNAARADALSMTLNYVDNANNETGFRAYKVTGTPGVYTKMGEAVAANVLKITFTDDVSSSPCYVVRAFNSIGESQRLE